VSKTGLPAPALASKKISRPKAEREEGAPGDEVAQIRRFSNKNLASAASGSTRRRGETDRDQRGIVAKAISVVEGR